MQYDRRREEKILYTNMSLMLHKYFKSDKKRKSVNTLIQVLVNAPMTYNISLRKPHPVDMKHKKKWDRKMKKRRNFDLKQPNKYVTHYLFGARRVLLHIVNTEEITSFWLWTDDIIVQCRCPSPYGKFMYDHSYRANACCSIKPSMC